MATVLAISSQVARGHVGLSAIVPVLQALGHEAIALPTIVLSNHPGHAHTAGTQIGADVLEAMLAALDRGGWLAGVDAVLTGYLPTREHVRLAARAVAAVRAAGGGRLFLCDPILGDDPKGLYIAEDAAAAIRDELLGLADCATPNRFELAWLTGRSVTDAQEAATAAAALGPRVVLATSVPHAGVENAGRIANLRVAEGAAEAALAASVVRRARVPHGTGDMMSALVLAHMLAGETGEMQLAKAVGGVEAAIALSEGRDELALVASRTAWMTPLPARVERLR